MVTKLEKKLFFVLVCGISLLFNLYLVSAGTTNVTECGTLYLENEIYELNTSLTSLFDCIEINATNITLDCMNYNITFGNAIGGFGIAVTADGGETGINNVTIRNCYLIQNESALNETAIFFGGGSENGIVYNNTIITYGNGSNGIAFETSSVNANITTNNITTFGAESHGIVLGDNVSNVNIVSNIVTTNNIESYGIILNELGISGSINLNDVTTLETGAHGILLGENGTGINITSNTVATSGEDASGIKMADGSSGLVYNNTVTATGNWSASGDTAMGGIWLESNTFDINVSSNTIVMSGWNIAGIWIWSCDNHSIETNIITSSGALGDGIYLEGVQGANITSNTINITGEAGDGIDSYNSEMDLLFFGNVITTSGDLGWGFNLDQTSNSNFSSNNVTTSGTDSYGIFSNQSHNNTITNNILTTGTTDSYVLYFVTTSNDSVYNNIFNTSTTGSGVFINDSDPNYFNTTNASTTNIIGRDYFGGNFWTNVNGSGYSDVCVNSNNDYFCDSAYVVVAGESHTDYLPLANHVGVVSACVTLDVANRYYVLNQSIEADGTCFNITANNITFDFAGFNVTGNSSGYGINITGYNDTTISNGSIYNFSNGIYISSSSGNAFDNININGSRQDAILLVGNTSDDNNFTGMNVANTNASYYDINFSVAGIDGTWITGINFANYTFAGAGGLVNFKEPRFGDYGEIVFLEAINGNGTDLGSDVHIGNNSVFINSSNNAGLNKSANISFYSVTYTDPKPQYSLDGSTWVNCTASTSPACVEFSFTAGGTFKFNVSYAAYFKIIEGYSAPDEEDTTSSSSSSSSGGGSTLFWTSTFVTTDEQFIEGYTRELFVKNRVRVKINNIDHHIGLVELTSTTAKINVSSDPQQAIFLIGDIRKFDVTEDGYYDIVVTLNGIANNKANITVKSISEEVTAETIEQEVEKEATAAGEEEVEDIGEGETSKAWVWVLAVVIVLIIILLGIGYKKFNKEK
ncbi:MAG: NosD domain-containing protein [archaeon]